MRGVDRPTRERFGREPLLFTGLTDLMGRVQRQANDEAAENEVRQPETVSVTAAIAMMAVLTRTSLRAERNSARPSDPQW